MIQFAIELNFMIMINAKARYLRPHVLIQSQSELENACAMMRRDDDAQQLRPYNYNI